MLDILKRLFSKKKAVDADSVSELAYNGPLKLCVMGNGTKVNYEPGGLYGAKCLWWVSEETDLEGQPIFIRESCESTNKQSAELPFTAAGKVYRNLGQLSPQNVIDGIDTDIYGRLVLCYRERFPCFDSYDYLHEHRYYRWFFLKEDGKLTRIYTADESGWIFVTEDAENIENKCTELLKKYGWVE